MKDWVVINFDRVAYIFSADVGAYEFSSQTRWGKNESCSALYFRNQKNQRFDNYTNVGKNEILFT